MQFFARNEFYKVVIVGGSNSAEVWGRNSDAEVIFTIFFQKNAQHILV